MKPDRGLHHVTAVARDPQDNVDFYHHVLGQRLVKRTVNFDDPGTYHFYYGDRTGSPGSLMTFFPWRNIRRGTLGNGETSAVAYAVPPDSIGFWVERLNALGCRAEARAAPFGEEAVHFHDPDGIALALVAVADAPKVEAWAGGPVPVRYALRGFHSVTLQVPEIEGTAGLLTELLGWAFAGREGNVYRYTGAAGNPGRTVDLLHRPGLPPGQFGAGSVHHIAFRIEGDSEQLEIRSQVEAAGYNVTPVKDRQYFRSIYFRSPGGVLFEIATDGPGFLSDEEEPDLGRNLRLPGWLEPRRGEIETMLPPITLKPGPMEAPG